MKKSGRRREIEIRLALSDGGIETITAEPVDIGDYRGMFCVHPRRVEVRQAATVMMNWVVSHIASGRALAFGYSRADAIREAVNVAERVGKRKLEQLTITHTLAQKRRYHETIVHTTRQSGLSFN